MSKNKTLEAIVSIAGQLDPSLQKSLASAQKQFSGLKIGMAAVGTAAVAATAAIVKFGADSVKAAAEFETQMANVSTLLDGTQEQVHNRINELSDDVLAVSNSTGVSTGELSDGLYQIISAVGDSEDAITQMELAAKAAKAGGAETTDAINLLTAVTKGYNDTSGEAFQRASDLAFTTVKLGQTSFPELASSLGKVIPLASALNVSQEELFGSFAALTGVTGSTAEVATQMKAVMSGLMSPTDSMTKALESLGYANANAALDSLGLQGTLDALGSTVGGDTQALAKMFSSVEAQTAILALAGAQAGDFASKTEAMYQASGMTDSAFEAQTDTLEYTIQVIKNLGQNFMTSVGRTILPYVKDAAEKLLPAVSSGLEALKPIMDSLFSKLSPIIEIAGTLLEGILPGITENFSKMQSIGSGVFEDLQPILSELAENLFPIFEQVFGNVTELFQTIAPVVAEFAKNLLPALGEVVAALMPIIQVLANALTPVFNMIAKLAVSLFPALTTVINALVPVINVISEIFTSVLGTALNNIVLPILQNITNAFVSLSDFITNIFTGNWSAAWENVKSIFANVFNALEGIVKAPMNAIISIINSVIERINGMGITIPDWVPGIGGKGFQLNVPSIPMLATGGFTDGPSIAGEAGTEAVISFDAAYRDENLSYWAQAGRMLGVDDSFLDTIESNGNSGGDKIELNVTYAPNISINGTANDNVKNDVIAALKENEEEFRDMLEDMIRQMQGGKYSFG